MKKGKCKSKKTFFSLKQFRENTQYTFETSYDERCYWVKGVHFTSDKFKEFFKIEITEGNKS